jgi:hypothetical protein
MPSSGMLHRMALVRTDVSEERISSVIRVTRIGGLGTTLAVTSNRYMLKRNHGVLQLLVTANVVPSLPILVILMMEVIHSCETSVLTRATRCNIPEDGIHLYILSRGVTDRVWVGNWIRWTLRLSHRVTHCKYRCNYST